MPPAKGALPWHRRCRFSDDGSRNGIVLSVFLASQASAQTNVMDPPPPGAMGMPAQPPIAPQPAMSESPAALGASGPSASPTTAAPASPTAAPPSRPSVPSGSAPSLAGQTNSSWDVAAPRPYSLPWGYGRSFRSRCCGSIPWWRATASMTALGDSGDHAASRLSLHTELHGGIARWG